MNEIIKLILSLSLSASIIALLLFTIKPFIKNRFSKAIQYYLWLIVIVRLILPFSIENSAIDNLLHTRQSNITIGSISNSANSASPQLVALDPNSPSLKHNDGSSDYAAVSSKYGLKEIVVSIWIFGVITAFLTNFIGYVSFLKKLNAGNKQPYEDEIQLLNSLLSMKKDVKLIRNSYVSTPMLIGIKNPVIIIPDIDFSKVQLKNVLLHEIAHLKRHDIKVKWMIMIASSLHWFNPLIYIIKREINHACELACDEAVIKSFNGLEKQCYGDTLISMASERKYSAGVLQATMSEEKKTMKERLVAIMNYKQKSKPVLLSSAFVLIILVVSAFTLGGGVAIRKGSTEINKGKNDVVIGSYNLTEISKHRNPYVGNASIDSAIVRLLPLPDKAFIQRYISLKTDAKPYGLTAYYEPASENAVTVIDLKDGASAEKVCKKNALILFCMIDNVDNVTFAFSEAASKGRLEEADYVTQITFSRADIEKEYGSLKGLDNNLQVLKSMLEEDKAAAN